MNTSVSHSGTSITPLSKDRLEYEREMIYNEFYGALIAAIKARKKEKGLTQTQLAARLGKDKTRLSKILSGPQNWQIGTVAELAVALDITLELTFRDDAKPFRRYTPSGASEVTPTEMSMLVTDFQNSTRNLVNGLMLAGHSVNALQASGNLFGNNIGIFGNSRALTLSNNVPTTVVNMNAQYIKPQSVRTI